MDIFLTIRLWKHIIVFHPRKKYEADPSVLSHAMKCCFLWEKDFDEDFWKHNFPATFEENIKDLREREEEIAKSIERHLIDPSQKPQIAQPCYFYKYDVTCIPSLWDIDKSRDNQFYNLILRLEILAHFKSSNVSNFRWRKKKKLMRL